MQQTRERAVNTGARSILTAPCTWQHSAGPRWAPDCRRLFQASDLCLVVSSVGVLARNQVRQAGKERPDNPGLGDVIAYEERKERKEREKDKPKRFYIILFSKQLSLSIIC